MFDVACFFKLSFCGSLWKVRRQSGLEERGSKADAEELGLSFLMMWT